MGKHVLLDTYWARGMLAVLNTGTIYPTGSRFSTQTSSIAKGDHSNQTGRRQTSDGNERTQKVNICMKENLHSYQRGQNVRDKPMERRK